MVELKVTGMTCGGCVNSVKRALLREFPDAKVDVDLVSGLVRIEGEVERARAEVSIKNAGFGVASPDP
jgi:copper chaperone